MFPEHHASIQNYGITMHHPKGFPSKLVRLRADAGMTQRDLAKASGLSVPQIGRYEMGTSTPRMTALVKLAKALNVEVSELENSEAEPETVEILISNMSGTDSVSFALPKSMVDELQEDAEAHGVSLEVVLESTIRQALGKRKGVEKSFDEIIAEVSDQYAKLPPQ